MSSFFSIGQGGVTARNNHCVIPPSVNIQVNGALALRYAFFLQVDQDGGSVATGMDAPVVIENNTTVVLRTVSEGHGGVPVHFQADAAFSNVTVRNNVFHAPNLNTPVNDGPFTRTPLAAGVEWQGYMDRDTPLAHYTAPPTHQVSVVSSTGFASGNTVSGAGFSATVTLVRGTTLFLRSVSGTLASGAAVTSSGGGSTTTTSTVERSGVDDLWTVASGAPGYRGATGIVPKIDLLGATRTAPASRGALEPA